MKKLVALILVAVIGVTCWVSYRIRRPETMLMHMLEDAQTTGDVTAYLTGNAQKTFGMIDKGGSYLFQAGLLSEEQVTQILVSKMSEIDWEFVSAEQKDGEGSAVFQFAYHNILTIDGTVTFRIVQDDTDENILHKFFSNTWKISDIAKIDF